MNTRKQQSAKEPRPKPYQKDQKAPVKRIESAQPSNQRRGNSQDYQSDTTKDKLNHIVSDYLIRMNYSRTAQQFEEEVRQNRGSDNGAVTVMINQFDQGQKEAFMVSWNKYVNISDHDTKKLEFYLQIYFLIYSIHPNTPKNPRAPRTDYREQMRLFKEYLDSTGMNLAQTSELINFYALAYVEQPSAHPTFKQLFTYDWLEGLREKLKQHIGQISNDDSLLKKLYLQQQGRPHDHTEIQQWAEKLTLAKQQWSHEKQDLENKIAHQQQVIQQQYDAARTQMFQSQQYWFNLARDLAVVSKDFLKMIDHNHENQVPFSRPRIDQLRKKLSQYENFLNRNVDDLMSQSQDLSLFDKASMIDQEQSNIMVYNPQLVQQTSQNQTHNNNQGNMGEADMIPLDYSKIINLFHTSKNHLFVSNVLQALRWRVTKPRSAYERRSVVVAYSTHDILGVHQRNISLIQQLLLKSHPKIQEFTLKLLNALASDYSGRSYLTQNQYLVRFLTEIIKREVGDSVKRKNAIGALQKLSLRKQAQLWMIENDLIKEILLILKKEKSTLSEYCYEYITALLMNLSLRSAGKDKLEQCRELAFELFLSLLKCPNDQIRTFINGTLYSLLSRKSFQEYANELNLMQTLQALHDEAGDRFQKQIKYMIDLLRQERNDEDVDETVSDQAEENDVDDIDDDEDCMAEDEEDEDQIADLNQEMVIGEELLIQEFALTGPEADKQKFITDSIVLKELQQRAQQNLLKQDDVENLFHARLHKPISDSIVSQLQNIQNLNMQQIQHIQNHVQPHMQQHQHLPPQHMPPQHMQSHIQQHVTHNALHQPLSQPSGELGMPPFLKNPNPYPQLSEAAFQSRPKIPRTPPVYH